MKGSTIIQFSVIILVLVLLGNTDAFSKNPDKEIYSIEVQALKGPG